MLSYVPCWVHTFGSEAYVSGMSLDHQVAVLKGILILGLSGDYTSIAVFTYSLLWYVKSPYITYLQAQANESKSGSHKK